MNPPLPAPSKRTVLGGIAILALMLGGLFAWRHWRTPVSTAEVAAYLDRAVGGGRLRFSAVQIRILQRDEADLQMAVAAMARPLEPLYSKIDAADYLQRKFQLDPESNAEARRLLADQGLSQNPEFRGAGPFPPDPYRVTVLQLQCSGGARFDFHGVINAHRDGTGWVFALGAGGLEDGDPHGEPRSAFGDNSLVAGDATDDVRLRALATDLQAFAGRVAEARRKIESARATAIEGRRKAFLAQIAPGRVFRGLARKDGEQQGTPLYLQIAELSPGNEVTAFLRNEGSWHIARTFQGSWNADDEFEKPVLNLVSRPDQAVENAGPFLENTQTWSFALRLDPPGELSERNRHYQYQFQPLHPEQVPALKERLEAEFKGAMTATEPELLYHGTAFSKTNGNSEPILLRFTGRSEGGRSIEAVLESTTRSWKRSLHGTIFANSRRSGGEPVRLRTSANEAAEDAPPGSALGDRDDLELRLGIKEGWLVGEDGRFTYRLAVASEADLHQLEADRAERARRFKRVFRAGIAYDGILHEAQEFTTHVRLEIIRLDRPTGAIAARISSFGHLSVHRDFLGTGDPSGGSIVLGARSRGSPDATYSPNTPFFENPAARTLYLALTGDLITGRIRGDPHSLMEFSAGAFLSVPSEDSEPNSPPANGSVFPPFPKSGGAYLLNRGSWAALPKNGGHVVVETVHSASELRLPTNIIAVVEAGVNELAKKGGKGNVEAKVPYLEFDGKDPRPKFNGPAMVLLFIGPAPTGVPPVELAPAETLPDGRRRIEIMGDSPTKTRLGDQRLAGYVRPVAPDAILLTSTSGLAPGPYVFNADVGYELIQE